MVTVTCAREYVQPLLDLKQQGKADHLKNIVYFTKKGVDHVLPIETLQTELVKVYHI